jgi:hypothetical protein
LAETGLGGRRRCGHGAYLSGSSGQRRHLPVAVRVDAAQQIG